MDVLKELESEVKKLQDAISERKPRAAFLRAEIDRLVSESLDATEAKAKSARTARAAHLSELGQVDAELSELDRRLEIATEAVKAHVLQQAQEAYEKAHRDATAARAALTEAHNAKLRFANKGERGGVSDSSAEAIKQIEIAIANAQATATIADRRKAAAGKALQLAQ